MCRLSLAGRTLPLLLLCLTTGCAEVAESARRSAADAAARATGRAVEQTIDGAAARATERVSTAGASSDPRDARDAEARDCQALLPDAEVARVCRVPTVDGEAVNGGPGACSRFYSARGGSPETALALVVTLQDTPAQARLTVQLGGAAGRPLRALGDGGMSTTVEAPAASGLGYTEHGVLFSAGATLVSLKAAQIAQDRPALCTAAQIETLASAVAARLR